VANNPTPADLRRFAAACRRKGLRCRVIHCEVNVSYIRVYRDNDDGRFDRRWSEVTCAAAKLGLAEHLTVVKPDPLRAMRKQLQVRLAKQREKLA